MTIEHRARVHVASKRMLCATAGGIAVIGMVIGLVATSEATPSRSVCQTMNVDDVMRQAQTQFEAGYAKAALSLVVKALQCRQELKMYRIAVLYACVAHDAAAAKTYYR